MSGLLLEKLTSIAFRLLSQSVYQMKDLKTDELGFIGKGKNSVRLVRTSLVLLVIIWIGLFIPMLGTDYGLRNRYAFYSPGKALRSLEILPLALSHVFCSCLCRSCGRDLI